MIDWLISWWINDWLVYWLIDWWLIGWLIDWLLVALLIDWLIDWLIRLPAQWSTTLILQFRSNKTSSWQTRTRNGRLPQIHSDHNKVGSDIFRSQELGKIKKPFCFIIYHSVCNTGIFILKWFILPYKIFKSRTHTEGSFLFKQQNEYPLI